MEEGAPTRRNVALNGSFLPHKGVTRTERSNLHPMQKRGVASKKSFYYEKKKEERGGGREGKEGRSGF